VLSFSPKFDKGLTTQIDSKHDCLPMGQCFAPYIEKKREPLFQACSFGREHMRILNRISNYWLCQIAGWGFVSLTYLFFAYAYGTLSRSALIKVGISILAGVLATHLLRWSIKQLNWLSLPIEKGLFRFLFGTIVASSFAGLIVLILSTVFKYTGILDFYYYYGIRPRFSAMLVMVSFDQGMFILPWVLIYCFYHYVKKTRHQLLRGQK